MAALRRLLREFLWPDAHFARFAVWWVIAGVPPFVVCGNLIPDRRLALAIPALVIVLASGALWQITRREG